MKKLSVILSLAALFLPNISHGNISPAPCTITNFSATPSTVVRGQTSIVSWTTQNCKEVRVESSDGVTLKGDSAPDYPQSSGLNGSVTTGPINHTTGFTAIADIPQTCPAFGCSAAELVGKHDTRQLTITITPNPPSSAPMDTTPHNVIIQGTVYLILGDGSKYPYTSAGAFLSYGFNSWTNIKTATQDEINAPIRTDKNGTVQYVSPRLGSLIYDHGTIYIITQSTGGIGRLGFPTMQTFNNLGYSLSNVFSADSSFLPSIDPVQFSTHTHTAGDLVNDNGTIYLLRGGCTKYGIPSLDIFNSWGFKMKDVVKANSYDQSCPVEGTVSGKTIDQAPPF